MKRKCYTKIEGKTECVEVDGFTGDNETDTSEIYMNCLKEQVNQNGAVLIVVK